MEKFDTPLPHPISHTPTPTPQKAKKSAATKKENNPQTKVCVQCQLPGYNNILWKLMWFQVA